MEILFVTSNSEKVKAIKKILGDNIKIKDIHVALKEIQGEPLEVAMKKANDAYEIFQKPLCINDSSFCIEALNNFPGAYAKYVEDTLKDTGILKLLDQVTNRKAYYLDYLIYQDAYITQVFEDKTYGTIALKSFDGNFYPYDKIFIRDGDEYPIAYYLNKTNAYQNKTYLLLKEFLAKRKVARGITIINNQVLLLHRIRKEGEKTFDYYAIPGGGVEDLESYEEACIREVLEEASIKVEIKEYLGYDVYETGVCYYFETTYLNGEIALGGEEKEHNSPENFYEIALVDFKDIKNLQMYGQGVEMILKVIKKYQNK